MNCETCVNYVFDESTQEYVCCADIDEDDLYRLYSSNTFCPFYRLDDEYGVVRHQN